MTVEEALPLPSRRVSPLDPPPELTRLSRQRPIWRLRYPDGHHGWLVTGYELSRAVLADARFSARSELKRVPVARPGADPFIGQPALPGWFVDMDPPQHTAIRRMLAGRFTARRVGELSASVQRIAEQRLAAMTAAGSPADLVADYALPLPSQVICELLGVSYADHAEFQRNSMVLFDLQVTAAEAEAAMRQLTDYLLDLVRLRRRVPDQSIIGHLAALGELTDLEIAGAGVLLLTAGHETVASMLGLAAFTLLTRPELLEQVRAAPERWPELVEDLLRYLTIFQFGVPRSPLEDVELAGQTLRVGETVTVSLPAANRDPARFADPDSIRLERSARGHLAFGFGQHQCIGQHLARLELRIGLQQLFGQLPGLTLATPAQRLHFHDDVGFYGVHRLPVGW